MYHSLSNNESHHEFEGISPQCLGSHGRYTDQDNPLCLLDDVDFAPCKPHVHLFQEMTEVCTIVTLQSIKSE